MEVLGAARSAPAGRCTMRLLRAHEMLQARAEAARAAGGDAARFVLALPAAVLARALRRGRRRVFRDAAQVLRRLKPDEIASLGEQYAALRRRDNPSPTDDEAEHAALLDALADSPYERLKWRVLRSFHVLPASAAARGMTDADYLLCALHTLLDAREYEARLCPDCRRRLSRAVCPGCGAPAPDETSVNPAFDEQVFAGRCAHGR